jgi:predicted nucleotidyltransferase
MLTREKILDVLRSNKSYFESELGVIKIGLFGSYAKNEQNAKSDVDIFLELEDYKKILAVLIYLESKLNQKIDMIYKGDHIRPDFLRTLERETIYA